MYNLQDCPAESMGLIEFDAVQNYIQDIHTVYPAIEGRVTLYASEDKAPGSASQAVVSMSVLLITIVSIFNCI